jgi:hypothetical protein
LPDQKRSGRRFAHVFVKLQVLRDDPFFAELVAHDHGPGACNPLVQLAIGEQFDTPIGHRLHVVLVTQKPRLAVLDDFGEAANT